MAEKTRLEICFEETLPATDLSWIADRLNAALQTARCGQVTGSETFTQAQYSDIWSKVYVDVSELESAVRTLRRELRAMEVGLGTWIVQEEPTECWYEVWFLDEANPPTWGW